MVHLDFPQGSREWLAARAGIVTASEANNITQPVRLIASTGKDYELQIIAERILGTPLESASSAFMERGHDMEERAVAWYAMDRDVDPEPCGFLLRDDQNLGASPDRLVGTDGLLEVKVPGPKAHVAYLLDPESLKAKYRGQTQVELLVSERAWVDLVSYNPAMPSLRVRIYPDDAYRAAFLRDLAPFLARVDAAVVSILGERARPTPSLYTARASDAPAVPEPAKGPPQRSPVADMSEEDFASRIPF